jgi:uroporphyrinogen decarboxylase
MNPNPTLRENLLSLYRRTGYTHAPFYLNLCPSQERTFREVAGPDVTYAEYFEYPEGDQEAYVRGLRPEPQDVDWRRFYEEDLKPGTTFDVTGVAHEPGSAAAHHMTRMHHPMKHFDAVEQFEAYPWPNFADVDDGVVVQSVADIHAQGKAAGAGLGMTIWETAWYMRGMPELMMDMATDDEKAAVLLDKVTDSACISARRAARAGVDILHLGDDIGMQEQIMMSRSMYREWLKPRLTRVIDAARAVKPDVLVFYHSCGYVTPLIEDLMEAGVDILNPVQPECMDFAEIHATYGEVLSFNGTLGTQSTMPFGTPEEVREVVLRNLENAGPDGGLFVCPTHLLEPEVPWANIEAYVRAVKDFSPA